MPGRGGLPLDVVVDVLSLLPAQSLIRFKCVRKSWRDIIEHPHFAAKHRRNHNRSSSNGCLLLMRRFLRNPGENENLLSFLSFANDNKDTSTVVKFVDLPIYVGEKTLGISGYCDGIICLSDSPDYVALANPGLRQFRVLPGSCISFPSSQPMPPCTSCTSGFGYDPKSDDYKVVRVWNFNYNNSPRAEVYTLSTDSWREIKGKPFIEKICCHLNMGKYFNGAYYWWTKDDDDEQVVYNEDDEDEDSDEDVGYPTREILIVFDMSEEVFLQIPFPESFTSAGELHRFPLILNESLALVAYHDTDPPEKLFNIWLVNEFGDDKSRIQVTKLSKIGPLSGVRDPLLFWNKDEILFESWNHVRIVSYKKGTHETKDLPLVLSYNFRLPDEVTAEVYTSSLISVARGN